MILRQPGPMRGSFGQYAHLIHVRTDHAHNGYWFYGDLFKLNGQVLNDLGLKCFSPTTMEMLLALVTLKM